MVAMNKSFLGKHVLIEFYDCDHDLLKDNDHIEKIMNEAAIIANATIVESVFHTFSPWGISGVVVISESHLTIHTWPEYNYAAVDLFTCGDTLEPEKAFAYLKDQLKSKECEYKSMNRGYIQSK